MTPFITQLPTKTVMSTMWTEVTGNLKHYQQKKSDWGHAALLQGFVIRPCTSVFILDISCVHGLLSMFN